MYFTLFFSEQKPNKGRELLELSQLEQKPNNSLFQESIVNYGASTTHGLTAVPLPDLIVVLLLSEMAGRTPYVRFTRL